MPDRLVCPFCQRKGFVRTERVISAQKAVTHYVCGICLREWDRSDPPPEHMPPSETPLDE
jgi:rubredoxin